MRELEFLPTWYHQTRRRRRIVMLLGWMTLVLVAGLGLWMFLIDRNVSAANSAVASLKHELDGSRSELVELEKLLELQRNLRKQKQVLQKVGMHVEGARLLATLDEAMSGSTALVELEYTTIEQPREMQPTAAATPAPNAERAVQMDRWLEVKLVCVAPSDVELADFYANLQSKPFFRSVRVTYTRDRPEQGHLMRQFEVLFSMDLNEPAGV